MKKTMKVLLGVFFTTLFLGTFVFLWQKTRPVKQTYEILTTSMDTIEKKSVATGRVEPRDEVLIKPQISGIISEVYKEAGQMVHQGDVIAKVKVIPDMGSLTAAQTRLTVANINLAQSEREFERTKQLYEKQVISKEEYEQSETELLKIQEEVTAARDNLAIVETGISRRTAEISNTQIRATITGMILDIPIKVGNSVIQSNTFNDGTTIASIADLGDMVFQGKVDETEVGHLKEGMPVEITIGALQEVKLNAELEYVAPQGVEENGIVMFEIKAAIEIPDSIFVRAGYSANATIVTDRRCGVLSIPESCVEFEGDKAFVNILTSDENAEEQTFERRDITLGLSNGIRVEVLSGLDGGEKLRGNLKSSNVK